ncbi:hypothetical protein JZ751_018532 [Albula glossodonta]|uniref:Uncharacterized protein n=1 Tax=Albula glossodonta TaxID=121402 RepID=A0A8T2NRL4_9TELE|nr:hypothetical protein JZ751_018532 [Albula glossodonta]
MKVFGNPMWKAGLGPPLHPGDDEQGKRVLVLSYPRYCRYRSVIARLRERPSSLLTDQVVLALGGIASLNSNTQILYCRETFDHPTLIENESISEEFDPCAISASRCNGCQVRRECFSM